jgi:hypothetical protein
MRESPRHDPLRRAARSLLQFLVGGGLVLIIDQTMLSIPNDLRPWFVIGAGALTTYFQNLAEDHGIIPAIGKAPASEGKNPVPDGRNELSTPTMPGGYEPRTYTLGDEPPPRVETKERDGFTFQYENPGPNPRKGGY